MKDLCSVTISVLTYNSSKFIFETLESIKAQTYPKIILQIADDCSTDNTIDICKEWIVKNKTRFVKTKIIIPKNNTGVSANCNRAWDACETVYHKEIAGDDILLPNCIDDNMKYMSNHPECIFLFSRMKSFGASKERCRISDEEIYLYDFFYWPLEKQYEFISKKRNCIPAPTAFVNIEKIRECGLRHDERIPLMEDVPKWLNALKMGIKFHFIDTVTVKYRLHEGSLSTSSLHSPNSYKSHRLFWFYYKYDEFKIKNCEETVRKTVDHEYEVYNLYYNILNSKAYKLGSFLLSPFKYLKKILSQ